MGKTRESVPILSRESMCGLCLYQAPTNLGDCDVIWVKMFSKTPRILMISAPWRAWAEGFKGGHRGLKGFGVLVATGMARMVQQTLQNKLSLQHKHSLQNKFSSPRSGYSPAMCLCLSLGYHCRTFATLCPVHELVELFVWCTYSYVAAPANVSAAAHTALAPVACFRYAGLEIANASFETMLVIYPDISE